MLSYNGQEIKNKDDYVPPIKSDYTIDKYKSSYKLVVDEEEKEYSLGLHRSSTNPENYQLDNADDIDLMQ